MSKLSNRLDKLESAIQIEHTTNQTIITRLTGEEAKEKEKEYILQQARSSLGLCEASPVIFLSRRLKEIREEFPRFPLGLSVDKANELIEEFENEAA